MTPRRSGPASDPGGKGDQPNHWSQAVAQRSNPLDLESGVFAFDDPSRIALSLKRSAEASARGRRRPTGPPCRCRPSTSTGRAERRRTSGGTRSSRRKWSCASRLTAHDASARERVAVEPGSLGLNELDGASLHRLNSGQELRRQRSEICKPV